MKKGNVKRKFINDFEACFYQLNDKEVKTNLIQQIKFQNEPLMTYGNTKPRGLIILSRVLVGLVIICALVMVGSLVQKRRQVNVDYLFQSANIEYKPEPIIASSSYKGEVLKIYQGIHEIDSIPHIQYFYYFNEISEFSNVEYLHFINRTRGIEEIVNKKINFGNLTELIDIYKDDRIEVVIVYKDNKKLIQYFTALE